MSRVLKSRITPLGAQHVWAGAALSEPWGGGGSDSGWTIRLVVCVRPHTGRTLTPPYGVVSCGSVLAWSQLVGWKEISAFSALPWAALPALGVDTPGSSRVNADSRHHVSEHLLLIPVRDLPSLSLLISENGPSSSNTRFCRRIKRGEVAVLTLGGGADA